MIPEPIENQIHELFIQRNWTLSLAESCTGGAVAARLTALSGASQYFLGSIVAYSNELKIKILGIHPTALKEKGAVSQEIAMQMVEGVISLTNSEFALAVTGIAGPTGGTASKPVGTVWCSFCRKGKKPIAWQLQLNGSREEIIFGSVNALLEGLLRYAQQELKE